MIDVIGNTPIYLLEKTATMNLFAKLETYNPTHSIKDRVAYYILNKAHENGYLKAGQLIVECSSGNMGTSLAAIGRIMGHPVHITVPSKTGMIKRKMIELYGAKLTVCPNDIGENGQPSYVNVAQDIAIKHNGYFVNQYQNQLNTQCHYNTTAVEIVEYLKKNNINLDYFVTVGGSGGTITGIAKALKEYNKEIQIIMPDPKGSVYYDYYYHGQAIAENIYPYQSEGPGNSVFCSTMDLQYIDEVIRFNDDDVKKAMSNLALSYGICAGHSTGANYHIVEQLRKRKAKKPLNVMFMVLDSGMKYMFE